MFGKNDLRLVYYRYKDSPYFSLGIISLVISACIILLFQVVIPQVQNWFSIANEVEVTRARLSVVNRNITFMNTLDKNALSEQLILSTEALPIEKDFGPIVNALSDAAITSGVTIDDYNFQPGNIASISGQFTDPALKDFGFTKVIVSLQGDAAKVQGFLQEVRENLPLSEVVKVVGDTQETVITLQFYQKQFPKITFKDDEPLTSLSTLDVALLQQLNEWQTIGIGDIDFSSGTSSAVPLF